MEQYTFLHGSKRIPIEEAVRFPILVAGTGNQKLVYAFESDKAVLNWAEGGKHAEVFEQMYKRISAAQAFERRDNSVAEARQKANVKRISKEFRLLADRLELDVGSEELFLKATVDAPILEGSIFDPVVLYDTDSYSGSYVALPNAPFPNLGWFGFNDRASSLLIHGQITLCENTWFKGRKAFFFGIPYGKFVLSQFGFSNRASSAHVF